MSHDPRRTAAAAGALFLTAMATSIAGGTWLDSILNADAGLAAVHTRDAAVVAGVLLELANCAAVVGIAAVLYPVLKARHPASAAGYTGFRVIEATLLAIAAVVPLAILALSRGNAAVPGATADSLGPTLLSMREQIYGLGVVTFFCLGAALLYSTLYRSRLVPAFISLWGLAGVACVFALNLLDTLDAGEGAGLAMLLALPIITNEIFLGLWLIVRGFDQPAVGFQPALEATS